MVDTDIEAVAEVQVVGEVETVIVPVAQPLGEKVALRLELMEEETEGEPEAHSVAVPQALTEVEAHIVLVMEDDPVGLALNVAYCEEGAGVMLAVPQ